MPICVALRPTWSIHHESQYSQSYIVRTYLKKTKKSQVVVISVLNPSTQEADTEFQDRLERNPVSKIQTKKTPSNKSSKSSSGFTHHIMQMVDEVGTSFLGGEETFPTRLP